MGQSPDISICIPTRNRAALLSRCLSHLMTFSSINYEVIIGDNASTDDTKDIVSSYADKLAHLNYLRHDADVGIARNIHSVLSRARGRYSYVLCDDDIVFENGLALLKRSLDASPELAASGGKHAVSDVPPAVGTNFNYGPARFFRITRGNFLALAESFPLCDGYPLLRTEIFRRHCSSHARGFGLLPLFSQLLAHGDILFVDQPIFQHLQNRESLSTNLAEPWFHDFCDADIEIAFANVPEPLPAETLEQIRLYFHRVTYFQSARMCRIRQDYPLMWHFLMRAKAVGGVTDACLIECERQLLLKVVIQRICQLIGDAAARTVSLERTPLLQLLKEQLRGMMPAVEFSSSGAGTSADEAEICLVESFGPEQTALPVAPTIIAFHDVLANMRLTRQPVQVTAQAGAIGLTISSRADDTDPGFGMLMTDYGLPTHEMLEASVARAPAPPGKDRIGRNDPCPCGSGKKYKACHGRLT